MEGNKQDEIRKINPNVALLCLDGDVWLYAETLKFLAWKLRFEGVRVIRIGCSGILDACTSINSVGKQGGDNVCNRCQVAQRGISADTFYEIGRADGVLSEDALLFLGQVKSRLEFGKISDVLDMQFYNMPLCRIAFFDFAIVTKLAPSSELTIENVNRFVAGVSDLLKLQNAFKRFKELHNISHLIFVNGNYSQNTFARNFFGGNGVACLSVEPQLTSQHILSKVMLVPSRLFLKPEGLLHGDAGNITLDAEIVSSVESLLENFGARIQGGDFNAYTSLNQQGISTEEVAQVEQFIKDHVRIHSFFLSSEDELTPHFVTHGVEAIPEPNPLGPYRTQLEFTTYLLKEAQKYPEIGFIIRLHPRMAVNKRDHFESEEHTRYKELLRNTNIPKNVHILYGDSKISSYFVISKSNLVIISWSTIGLEALLLGIPVVAIFPNYLMYPITAFTEQPSNLIEMNSSLFAATDWGRGNDRNLLVWMSMAFEGRFYSTAAPRGRGGKWGKLYRGAYRVVKKLGVYGILAWIVNLIYLRNVTFNYENLLAYEKRGIKVRSDGDVLELLREYRKNNNELLESYWDRLINSGKDVMNTTAKAGPK